MVQNWFIEINYGSILQLMLTFLICLFTIYNVAYYVCGNSQPMLRNWHQLKKFPFNISWKSLIILWVFCWPWWTDEFVCLCCPRLKVNLSAFTCHSEGHRPCYLWHSCTHTKTFPGRGFQLNIRAFCRPPLLRLSMYSPVNQTRDSMCVWS